MLKPSLTDLRASRDPWKYIKENIPLVIATAHDSLQTILNSPDLEHHLERKYRKGEAEYHNEWLSRDEATWLVMEADEEILDFIVYCAMFMTFVQSKAIEDHGRD
jgi:hypothetical protein